MKDNRELKFITKSLKNLISLSERKSSSDKQESSRVYSSQFQKFQDSQFGETSKTNKFLNYKTEILEEEIFQNLTLTSMSTYNFEKSHSRIKICDKRQYIIELSEWFNESIKNVQTIHEKLSPIKIFKLTEEIFSFVLNKLIDILGIYSEDGKVLFKNLWNSHLGIVVSAMDYIEKRYLNLEKEHVKEITRIHRNYQRHLETLNEKNLLELEKFKKPDTCEFASDTYDLAYFIKRQSIIGYEGRSQNSFSESSLSNGEKQFEEPLNLSEAKPILTPRKEIIPPKKESTYSQTKPIMIQVKQTQTNAIECKEMAVQVKVKKIKTERKIKSLKPFIPVFSNKNSPLDSPKKPFNKLKRQTAKGFPSTFRKETFDIGMQNDFESSEQNSEDIIEEKTPIIHKKPKKSRDLPSNFLLNDFEEDSKQNKKSEDNESQYEGSDYNSSRRFSKFSFTTLRRQSLMKPLVPPKLNLKEEYHSVGANTPSHKDSTSENKSKGSKNFTNFLKKNIDEDSEIKQENAYVEFMRPRKKEKGHTYTNISPIKKVNNISSHPKQKSFAELAFENKLEKSEKSQNSSPKHIQSKVFSENEPSQMKSISTIIKNVKEEAFQPSISECYENSSHEEQEGSSENLQEIQTKVFANALNKIKIKYESPDEFLVVKAKAEANIPSSRSSQKEIQFEKETMVNQQKQTSGNHLVPSSIYYPPTKKKKKDSLVLLKKLDSKNRMLPSLDFDLIQEIKNNFTNSGSIIQILENINGNSTLQPTNEILQLIISDMKSKKNTEKTITSNESIGDCDSSQNEIVSPNEKNRKLSNFFPNPNASSAKLKSPPISFPLVHPKIYEHREEDDEENEIKLRVKTEGASFRNRTKSRTSIPDVYGEKNIFKDKSFTQFKNLPTFLSRKKTPFVSAFPSKIIENSKFSLSIIEVCFQKKPILSIKKQAFIKQLNLIFSEAIKYERKGKFQIFPISLMTYQVFMGLFGLPKVAGNKMLNFLLTAFADLFPLSILYLQLLGIKENSHSSIKLKKEDFQEIDFGEDPLELSFISEILDLGRKGNVNLQVLQIQSDDFQNFLKRKVSHFTTYQETNFPSQIDLKNKDAVLLQLLHLRRKEKQYRISKIENLIRKLNLESRSLVNFGFIHFICLYFSPFVNFNLLIEYYFEFSRMYGTDYITTDFIASMTIDMGISFAFQTYSSSNLKNISKDLKTKLANSEEDVNFYLLSALEIWEENQDEEIERILINFMKMKALDLKTSNLIPENLNFISKTFNFLFIEAC